MANINEVETYDENIYQLEMTDDAIGGENGTMNKQAKALANRTRWLKAKIDAFLSGAVKVKNAILADTATKLATPRKINGVDFDGSTDITIYENKKIYELTCNSVGFAEITIPMGLGRDSFLLADIIITARHTDISLGWAFWKGKYLFNFASQNDKNYTPFFAIEEAYSTDIIAVSITRPDYSNNSTRIVVQTSQANKTLFLCVIEKITTIQGEIL